MSTPTVDEVATRPEASEPPPVAPAALAKPAPPRLGRPRTLIAGLLCLLNAAISGVLLLQHHGVDPAVAAVNEVCGESSTGAPSGCDLVARSRYSELRGIPLAAIGIVVYGSLAVLLLLASLAAVEARLVAGVLSLAVLLVALVADVALLFVQMVAVRAFCRLCLLTYLIGAVALVLLLPARHALRTVLRGGGREGRLVLTGWVMASLALAAGVYAGEKGLGWRERLTAGSILGAPPPLRSGPAASPEAPSTEAQRYKEEARVASEQARRLQEVLDDPQKLDRFFSEKAAREYEQGPVQSLKVDGVPFKGPADAPIKVVEFSDFLCPFCRSIAAAFGNFLPQSQGRVAVYFKNYPLDSECNPHVKPSVHPGACAMALAGICAHEQGKFWPYHDRVFANPPSEPKPEDVVRIAGEAGLDATAFQSCLGSAKAKDRLAAEIKEAQGAGVSATPTLFLNGRRLPRLNDFLAMVDKESARLGLPPLTKPQP